MAIKVNGTTVIDDSRNLSNVGGLKTVNGNSLVGSGNISAGASTTVGAVGQYGFLKSLGGTVTYARYAGSTQSGSNLRYTNYNENSDNTSSNIPSGTWQILGFWEAFGSGASVWQRIS